MQDGWTSIITTGPVSNNEANGASPCAISLMIKCL